MQNRRFKRNRNVEKPALCSCGGQIKSTRKRNYPHGRKSKALTVERKVCKKCKTKFDSIKYN